FGQPERARDGRPDHAAESVGLLGVRLARADAERDDSGLGDAEQHRAVAGDGRRSVHELQHVDRHGRRSPRQSGWFDEDRHELVQRADPDLLRRATFEPVSSKTATASRRAMFDLERSPQSLLALVCLAAISVGCAGQVGGGAPSTAGTSGGAAGASGTTGGSTATAGRGGSAAGTGGASPAGTGGSSSGGAGPVAGAGGNTGAGGTAVSGALTLTNLKIDPNPRMTLSCYVSWTTSVAANSEVQFGVGGYQFRIVDSNQVTSHKVHVVGMHAQTAYQIKAVSTNATATGSATGTFTTGALPANTPKATVVTKTVDKIQPGWTLMNAFLNGTA